ncbi:GNAT family N-acetyltransferase [Halobacillus naozhouensis]|uniref:GNAT family N-acetyltransferase n=1 Tax=Halobacillus naozhouensis TaxID=554880 RepID=A0ABY8IY01_9BACI|nr:GNAT family N-acetyltransferase [Halobacillus naozhouensis]WFT75118.1 GNAT family N-acetyltransferase [Halobacillus naozhouensis]
MRNIAKEGDQFVMKEDGNRIAEISVVPSGSDRLIVDHTFVSEAHREEGNGEKLVEKVVQFAREENKKIIPLCSFTKNVMEQNEAYHDVLI